MPTFIYAPGDSVTLSPGGDVSITSAGVTTTFSKTGASKGVTQTSPGGSGPTLESPLTQKLKPSGDLIHTYSDITKTPPVTTRITYRSSGDVEILITIGENRTLIDIHALTGLRRTRLWKDPDPEPQTWAKIESPKGGSQIAPSGNGSKGRHKPKKSARRPRPEKRRAAKRMPKKKKSKSKARRR